jgi:outer membrane immunogenic protein
MPLICRRLLNYYKAPPPPPVYNWTGCYIAGGGGYGWWNQDSQVVVTATGAPVLAQVTNGGKGWFGQGQGGCDYQFNMPLELESSDRHWRVR